MFKTRLLSGIVLVVLALVTIISGGEILWATCLIISLIGMKELYHAVGVENSEKKAHTLAYAGYLGAIIYYLDLYISVSFQKETYSMITIVFVLVLIMFFYIKQFPAYRSEQVMATFFGVFYVAVMLSYIYQTRILEDGAFLVWLIFLCSWGCDTCAYCVGMLFGKHKMTPKLSPKKTIEGAVGGVIGAGILGGVYAFSVSKYLVAEGNAIFTYSVICMTGALVSMVGDLAASAIKRNHNIKDYGTLIPGHGGILDRFDSVIFTAPMIYFLAIVLN